MTSPKAFARAPPKVFISHSKLDAPLTKNVRDMLKNVGIDPVIMEYEPPAEKAVPPWRWIRDAVTEADLVLLVKTENAIVTPYTHSWIIYEVGVAAAMSKPLYVVDRKSATIEFPIPYVTDYMLFEHEKVADFLKLQKVLKDWKEGKLPAPPSGPPAIPPQTQKAISDLGSIGWQAAGYIIAFLLAAIFGEAEALASGPVAITCGGCGSGYRYYAGILDPFQCPVCLKPVDPSTAYPAETVDFVRAVRGALQE